MIIKFIKSIVELPPEEEEKFVRISKPLKILKGEYYIREGQVPKKLSFVEQGLFRYLYMDTKGNEFTKNFIAEGNVLSSYSAMVAQQPSKMFIEALEDSVVHDIHYSDWLELRKGHPCWNAFLVVILEKAFTLKETRERESLLLDAQERYDIFRAEFPTFEHRVRQHLIASYLGISPILLSRIRNSTIR